MGRLYQTSSAANGKTQFIGACPRAGQRPDPGDGAQVVVEYDGGTLAMRRRFYWGPGDDEPILQDEGGALNCSGTRFLHPDDLGSIVAAADCWGNRTNVNTYDEYGIPASSNWGRYQFTGQAFIGDLGMYYYKARLYSPTLGRFMQTDPIGYADGPNWYVYAHNDPVNGTDPSGLFSCALSSCPPPPPTPTPVGEVVVTGQHYDPPQVIPLGQYRFGGQEQRCLMFAR